MSREKKYKILYILSRIFGLPKRIFLGMYNHRKIIWVYLWFIIISQFLILFLMTASRGFLYSGFLFRFSILDIGWECLGGIIDGFVTVFLTWSEWFFYPMSLFIAIAILTKASTLIASPFEKPCKRIRDEILEERYIPLIDKVLTPGDKNWIEEEPESSSDYIDTYWSADPITPSTLNDSTIWLDDSQNDSKIIIDRFWKAVEQNSEALVSNDFAPGIDPFVARVSVFSRFYDKYLAKGMYFAGVVFFFLLLNWVVPYGIKRGNTNLLAVDPKGITWEALSKMPNSDYKKVEDRDWMTLGVWGCVYDFRFLSDYDTWTSYMDDYRIGISRTDTIYRDGRFFDFAFTLPRDGYYVITYLHNDTEAIYWEKAPRVRAFNRGLHTVQIITYTIMFYLPWAILLACIFPALFGHSDIDESQFNSLLVDKKKGN